MLDACEPVFSALFELQSARPAPDVDTLYGSLAGQLAAVRGRAGAAGLSDQEADAVTFALAAFADEMVMRSDWEGRGQWPLLEYAAFGTHNAGEQFFRVLGQGQDTSNGHHPLAWEGTWRGPGGAAVLEVYALCLLFGFRGRHSVTGPDAYQRELARVLAYIRARPPPLESQAPLPALRGERGGTRPEPPDPAVGPHRHRPAARLAGRDRPRGTGGRGLMRIPETVRAGGRA